MALTPLPPAPARTQASADFSATADTFMAALPGLVTEINLITDPASAIHASGAKTTHDTADEFGIWDSVSLALRKCTWGNIVTTLQTAFASLTFSVGTATAAANAVRADQNKNELTSVSATIATGKLTLGLQPCIINFRNSDVTNGAPSTKFVSTALTLATDNNGASFGLMTAVQGRLYIIAIDNGTAAPVLGVNNSSGGIDLSEEGVLTSTTAITGAVVSPTAVYTTVALGAGLYPYKIVGAVDITWTSGSGFITAIAKVIGAGGNALTAISSLGYGQTWQTVTRTAGVTYYSPNRPIELLRSTTYPTTNAGYDTISINGGAAINLNGIVYVTSGSSSSTGTITIPQNSSYVISVSGVATTIATWELR